MKLGVIGSRNFKDKNRVFLEINELRKRYPKIDTIVSGGANGADTFGENYADERGLKKKIFLAKWNDFTEPCLIKTNIRKEKYNALAGLTRNTKIIEYSDIILAFWDGKSSGTRDALMKAKEKNVPVIKVMI